MHQLNLPFELERWMYFVFIEHEKKLKPTKVLHSGKLAITYILNIKTQ